MDDGTNPFEIEDKPAKKSPAKRAEKQAARKSEPKKTTEKAPAKPRRSPRKAEPEEKLHALEDGAAEPDVDLEESTEDSKPEEKTLRVIVEPEAPSFQVVGELPQSRQSKNFFVSAEKVNGLTVVSISQKGWVGPPQITFLAKQVDELRDLLYSFEKE